MGKIRFIQLMIIAAAFTGLLITLGLLKYSQDKRSRANEETPQFLFSPNPVSYGYGMLFPIDIYIDAKSQTITVLDFKIMYDHNTLRMESFLPEKALDTQLSSNEILPTDVGTFHYYAVDTIGKPITGKVKIASILFRAINGGNGLLKLSNIEVGYDSTIVKLEDSPASIEIINPLQQEQATPASPTISSTTEQPTSIPVVTSQPTTKVEPTITSSGTTQNKSDSSSNNQQNNSSGNSSFWDFFKKSPTSTSNPTHTQQTTPNPTTAPQSPQTKQTQPTQQTPTSVVSCTTKAQGDANCDGKTNISDLNVWKTETASQRPQNADFNSDGKADLSDYLIWRKNAL